MEKETIKQRSKRILGQLKSKYPGKNAFDLDGRGLHFACEIEPTENHPEYDRAIEVIISSKPHKHSKMIQQYTIINGVLELHVGNKTFLLKTGDIYTVKQNKIHWATSNQECWVEVYSKPGWTKEDHITIS